MGRKYNFKPACLLLLLSLFTIGCEDSQKIIERKSLKMNFMVEVVNNDSDVISEMPNLADLLNDNKNITATTKVKCLTSDGRQIDYVYDLNIKILDSLTTSSKSGHRFITSLLTCPYEDNAQYQFDGMLIQDKFKNVQYYSTAGKDSEIYISSLAGAETSDDGVILVSYKSMTAQKDIVVRSVSGCERNRFKNSLWDSQLLTNHNIPFIIDICDSGDMDHLGSGSFDLMRKDSEGNWAIVQSGYYGRTESGETLIGDIKLVEDSNIPNEREVYSIRFYSREEPLKGYYLQSAAVSGSKVIHENIGVSVADILEAKKISKGWQPDLGILHIWFCGDIEDGYIKNTLGWLNWYCYKAQ